MPADADLSIAVFDPRISPWPELGAASIHLWLLPHRAGEASTAALRDCIARYCRIESARVELERDAAGKPWLREPRCDLRFSASHSGDQLALAFLHGTPDDELIGVDLELSKPRPRALELARRFFTCDEADALAALPADQQERTFYRLWVAKEATLKAMGRGLAHGLDKVAFAFTGAAGDPQAAGVPLQLAELDVQAPSDPAREASVLSNSIAQSTSAATDAIADWNLHEFAVEQAIGCIAWTGAPRRVVTFRQTSKLGGA